MRFKALREGAKNIPMRGGAKNRGGANHFYEKWGECRWSWEILREVEMTLHYFGGSVVNLWSFWGEYTTMSIKIRALHAKWGDTVISKNSA